MLLPYRIYRRYVQQHPEIIFLYGHDYYGRGCLGQCWEVHGEPNSYAIPTHFQDALYLEWIPRITERLLAIPHDGRPIIKLRRIGEGCSRMKELAPNMFKWLHHELDKIVTPYTIDYNNPYDNHIK